MPFSASQALVLFAVLALLLAGALARRGRRLDLRRSVLIHAPAARVWEALRHFPTLHERHAKSRDFAMMRDCELRAGDGEGPGSIWRVSGTWEDAPYWADVEIVRCEPGREIAFHLVRDSFGTHRSLRGHLGTLALEALDPGTTKLTWILEARLRGPRLLAARWLSRERLQARLLDHGLRSIKIALERPPGVPAMETAAGRAEPDRPRPDEPPPPPPPRPFEPTL